MSIKGFPRQWKRGRRWWERVEGGGGGGVERKKYLKYLFVARRPLSTLYVERNLIVQRLSTINYFDTVGCF